MTVSSPHIDTFGSCTVSCNVSKSVTLVQVLKDAKAIDDAYAAGKSIEPLCGLAFAVKDNIDVVG